MSPRSVIVHLHLFKNAGTSVERSLSEFFGESWVSYDPTHSGGRFGQAELEQLLISRPEVAALSSHQLRPPLVSNSSFTFVPIIFLRHPLDRIRSAYEFERNQGGVSPSSRAAETSTMVEWIEFHRGRGSTQCSNFQTYALSSIRSAENHAPLMKVPLEEHLGAAVAFVEGLGAVGVVERYERSWSRLSKLIAGEFAQFDASAVWANATSPGQRSADLSERLGDLRDRIGESHYRQLEDDNQADLVLHQAGLSLLESEAD